VVWDMGLLGSSRCARTIFDLPAPGCQRQLVLVLLTYGSVAGW